MNEDGFISLNQMWEAAGRTKTKDPRRWLDTDEGKDKLLAIAGNLNVAQNDIYISRRGRGGGTWAHPHVAVQYAQYLSPDFAAWVSQVVVERAEEEHDPDLAFERGRDRAIAGYKRQGKDDTWIGQRLDGKLQRHRLTDTLQAHGVHRAGYARCTDAINKHVLGAPAAMVKAERGLKKTRPLRDALDGVELAAINLAEQIAERDIERQNAQCAASLMTSTP